MTTKVVKGSLWTLVGQALPIGISLLTAPFVIRLLGSERYGAYILVGLIPAYFNFADFGMCLASTMFGSEAYASGSLENEARIVRTAAIIALTTSLPIALALFLLSSSIIEFFRVSDSLHEDAALALKFASISFVLTFLNGIFNTPQLTRLRMDLNVLVSAGFRSLGMIAVPVVIYLGGGISGAVFALMITQLLTLIGNLAVSERLSGELFNMSISHEAVRPMLKFGGAWVSAGIATILLINAEKGILAATVSTQALAYYSVAFTVANMITLFSSSMVQSLIPAFSQLQGPHNRERLSALYSRGLRMNLIILVPLLVLVAMLARPFFTLWAGEDFARESTIPFYILLVGLATNVMAYLPYVSIIAAGRTDILAKIYWIELSFYILLVWILTTNFGIAGAAVSWSFRCMIDTLVQFVTAKRLAKVSFLSSSRPIFLSAVSVMLVPLFVAALTGRFWLEILAFTICLAIYMIIIWTSILNKEEKTWLNERLHLNLRTSN